MNIIVRYKHWLPKLISAQGIVVYPFVLFADSKKDVSEVLHKHEMAHVRQVREIGWLSFYVSYLLSSVANYLFYKDHKQAYLNIPHEIDARSTQYLPLTQSEKSELSL